MYVIFPIYLCLVSCRSNVYLSISVFLPYIVHRPISDLKDKVIKLMKRYNKQRGLGNTTAGTIALFDDWLKLKMASIALPITTDAILGILYEKINFHLKRNQLEHKKLYVPNLSIIPRDAQVFHDNYCKRTLPTVMKMRKDKTQVKDYDVSRWYMYVLRWANEINQEIYNSGCTFNELLLKDGGLNINKKFKFQKRFGGNNNNANRFGNKPYKKKRGKQGGGGKSFKFVRNPHNTPGKNTGGRGKGNNNNNNDKGGGGSPKKNSAVRSLTKMGFTADEAGKFTSMASANEICVFYNIQKCKSNECRYWHYCVFCGGQHPGLRCRNPGDEVNFRDMMVTPMNSFNNSNNNI